jgi:hypothetical protein
VATIEPLMKRTVRSGDCIEWTGYVCKSGYGLVWHEGKNRSAHRVSFELHNTPIMNEQHVMHICDNRRCINPSHLKLGTRIENMADMNSKGRNRQPSGAHHPNAKITPQAAEEIRRRYTPYSKKDGSMALAREFNVSQGTVSAVLRGVTWKSRK